MSMSGPASGGDEEGGLFTEINVTPLTDIFLVLLIIFMVTASGLSTSSMNVSLPKASAPGSVDASSVVTVSLDARDRLFMGTQEVSPERLEASIRAALATAKDPSVVLAGDKVVTLEKLAMVMDAARRAGAKRFAIAVAQQGGKVAQAQGGKTVETAATASVR